MSLHELQLQAPPPGPFSVHGLKWSCVSGTQSRGREENTVLQTYQVARISRDRRKNLFTEKGRGVPARFTPKGLTVRLQRGLQKLLQSNPHARTPVWDVRPGYATTDLTHRDRGRFGREIAGKLRIGHTAMGHLIWLQFTVMEFRISFQMALDT